MFVRKKRNRSGTTSVSVVFKNGGTFKEVHHLGSSADPTEIQRMYNEGKDWIARYGGQQQIDFEEKWRAVQAEAAAVEQAIADVKNTLSHVERTTLDAPQTILNRIYDRIGFNEIEDDILRHLAIARVCQPMSKVATVEYLKSYFDEDIQLHKIYRYMDKLHSTQREKIQRISVAHTMDVLGGRIGLVFYDVTTLYFESAPDPADELRQDGFSKDGKTAESQIVLGLLVSEDGYPLSYSIFNGKQYEGYTMIPIIDDFVQRFSLTDFIVVADSGLMSEKNVALLESAGYKYILGARIRSESPKVKEWLLGIDRVDGHCEEYAKKAGRDLQHLALSLNVPSGWEIVNDRMAGGAEDGYDHKDIRDNAVRWYFGLPAGRFKTFSVQLRAAYEGRFVLPAATVEALYEPGVAAATAPGVSLVQP